MSAGSKALGAVALLAVASPTVAQQYGDPRSGERIVAQNCAQCHGSIDAPNGAPAFVTIATMPSTTEQSLGVFLQTSHGSMPDLILSPEDRSDVISYIMSLRP
jgi:cytochrome c